MKKRMLLFTCSAFLVLVLFASNAIGPISGGNGNRTGSQGSTANCSTGAGCHATNTTNTKDSIFFFMPDGLTGVPSWLPGQSYKVRLLVRTSNISLGKFGYQLSSVRDSAGTEVQAGTFGTAPFGSQVKNAGVGLKILEHLAPQTLAIGTGTITIDWVAPNTDTIDTVKFYTTANVVDFTGTSANDEPNTAMWIFPRNTTSVKDLNADIKLNIFPNPVTDKLNISMENADKGKYTIRIFDVQGKTVATQSADVSKTYKTSINASAWASGIYHVQISKDGAQRTLKFVK